MRRQSERYSDRQSAVTLDVTGLQCALTALQCAFT